MKLPTRAIQTILVVTFASACASASDPTGDCASGCVEKGPPAISASGSLTTSSTSPDGSDPAAPEPPCTFLPLKAARAPKLLWTCQRQHFLTALADANHPQWAQLVAIADRSDTASAAYDDVGGYAALVYQITGDTKYAVKGVHQALAQLRQNLTFDLNYTRDKWAEYAIVYDWLQGGIDDADATEMRNALYGWADQFFARDPVAPIRTNDTDQTTGNYFGIMLLALATPDDPRSAALMAQPFVGGLDATGSDLTTLRNAVHKYMTEWAAGGQWIESSYYDVETLQLVVQGVEAMRTAMGVDHFPEFAGWNEQVLLAQMVQLAPDLDAAPKWGDNENVRDVQAWRRWQTLGMYTGTLAWNSALRPIATQLINDLKALHASDLVYQARYFYYFDPAAPAQDWRSALEKTHYASGQGMVFAHDTWDTDGSIVQMHLRRPAMNIDHENSQFGDFQIYRKSAWVLTRPLGYGGGSVEPLAVNAMVLAGLDAMTERAVLGQSSAADGSYVYFAGNTHGARYAAPYYNPPPEFVHEWTRSYLYLPTPGKTADTVIVHDRVDADAPTRTDRYQADDQTRMTGAAHRKQFVLHALEAPTVTATGASWVTSGQNVELTTLAPAAHTASVVDEHTLGWPASFPVDSELHYYIAVSPTVDQTWDTFLDVVQASDAPVAQKPSLIASTDGGMEGAHVSRPGTLDAIALFSATQGTRLRATAFTVNVAAAAAIDVYVADLDPGHAWTASPGGALALDGGGLAHVQLPAGTTAITLTPN